MGQDELLARENSRSAYRCTIYRGHFHYYTGPKSITLIRHPPVNDDLTSEMDQQMERLTLENKRQLHEFSSTFGANVRQHTVRDKSKEETGCLPYAVSGGAVQFFFLPW